MHFKHFTILHSYNNETDTPILDTKEYFLRNGTHEILSAKMFTAIPTEV